MKIQAETMKRIFADMTAIWNTVPKAKQDEMREALASGTITITNLGWQLYHLAFADRNYDDSHPRYQTRARILPLAPFPMYPDGANDDHMATMFKRFELPAVTPPADEPSQDEEEEEETRERITCDQCELLAINGVCCHETGCPNMGSRWDAENREWIKQRKCFECGYTVDADDPCCSAPFEEDETEEEGVLRSTVDTSEMEQAVLSEARETLERHNLTATFEHGHWWIEDTADGSQWSVVDCESQTGEEYFDFEQVTQGDED